MLIRTFETTAGRVELGVGGGITVDSVPVREWQECLHKAEPLAVAAGERSGRRPGRPGRPACPTELAGQGVFESILTQHGRPLRLADHLARLARSVRELYAADLPRPRRPGRRVAADHSRARGSRSACTSDRVPTVRVTSAARPLGPRLSPARSPSRRRADHAGGTSGPTDRTAGGRGATAPAAPYFSTPGGWPRPVAATCFVHECGRRLAYAAGDDHLLPGVTRRALRRARRPRAPVDHAHRATTSRRPIGGVDQQPQRGGGRPSGDGRPLSVDETASTWSRWLGLR